MLKYCMVVAAGLLLSGCANECDRLGPVGECAPKMRAKFLDDGFNLSVTHTRYQYMADLNRMFDTCRASIHYFADRIATEKGVQIEPIDNDKIAMDYSRNDTLATSSCTATYPVAYKQ